MHLPAQTVLPALLRRGCLALFLVSIVAAFSTGPLPAADQRVFELRIYTTYEGRLEALHKRFREHTNRFFVKHGMSLIGYWTPTEAPESKNTLIYILAYPSRSARDAAWKAFRADPEWNRAKEESEKDGKIVREAESKFLLPTAYSPLQ
jgi:hypothetical protein